MITLSDDLAYVIVWSVRVDGAFLVQKVMDGFPVAEDDNIAGDDFKRVYRAIFPCPNTKSRVVDESEMVQLLNWNLWTSTHCFPSPVVGIWRALPRIGTVFGPLGMRGSRRPSWSNKYKK